MEDTGDEYCDGRKGSVSSQVKNTITDGGITAMHSNTIKWTDGRDPSQKIHLELLAVLVNMFTIQSMR